METEKLYFSTIKEPRSTYFVEYRPPVHGFPFATLQLTYTADVEHELVASAMEREASIWFERFPVPLMVSAFDSAGDLYLLDGTRTESHLLVFLEPDTGTLRSHWRLLKNEEISPTALDSGYLLKIYAEVGRRTSSEIRHDIEKHARKIRIGWFVVFFWVAVTPAAFLIFEYFGPEWVAALMFIYGLFKAAEKALKMLGKWKKSLREIAKEEDERRMRHHHYHCERNPEGFDRLKLENFQREARERVMREAASIEAARKAP